MKIRGATSNVLNLHKCYPDYDSKQHLRGFTRRSNILDNVNTGTVIFKPYKSKSI